MPGEQLAFDPDEPDDQLELVGVEDAMGLLRVGDERAVDRRAEAGDLVGHLDDDPPTVLRAAAILGQFDDEMTRGRISNAMIVAMRGSEMGPGWFRALPTWLTARLVSTGMNREPKEPAGEYPTMRELAPTLHADFVVVTASSGPVDGLGTIPAEVLLMGGSRSPAFLKRALDDLARALPTARRIELEGMDHAASWNADRRGHPKPVARELRGFFA
jgi:hypothetical protein